MKKTSILELATIIILMFLALYPAMELTRMIYVYTTHTPALAWWGDYGDRLLYEAAWKIWLPYFAAPMFLAFIFWGLDNLRKKK